MTAAIQQNIHSVLKQVEHLTLSDMPKADQDEGAVIDIASREDVEEKNPIDELGLGLAAISLRPQEEKTRIGSERSSSGSSANFADDETEADEADKEEVEEEEEAGLEVEPRGPTSGQKRQNFNKWVANELPPFDPSDENEVAGKYYRPNQEPVEHEDSNDFLYPTIDPSFWEVMSAEANGNVEDLNALIDIPEFPSPIAGISKPTGTQSTGNTVLNGNQNSIYGNNPSTVYASNVTGNAISNGNQSSIYWGNPLPTSYPIAASSSSSTYYSVLTGSPPSFACPNTVTGSPSFPGTQTNIPASPSSQHTGGISPSRESSGYHSAGDFFAMTPESYKDPGSPEFYECLPPVTVENETVSPATSGELPNIDVLKKPLSTEIKPPAETQATENGSFPRELTTEIENQWVDIEAVIDLREYDVPAEVSKEESPQEKQERYNANSSRKRTLTPILPRPPSVTGAAPAPQQMIMIVPQRPPQTEERTTPSANVAIAPRPLIPHPFEVPSVALKPLEKPSRTEEQKALIYVAKLHKEDLTKCDDEGDSLLHLFILKGLLAHVTAFLTRCKRQFVNIDQIINQVNNLKQTPVYLATYMNQPSMVAKLVDFGADVNLQAYASPGRSPLHYSVTQGDAFFQTTAQLLRSHLIKIDSKNGEGKTALHCAIEAHRGLPQNKSGEIISSIETIRRLVLSGASLSEEDGKSGKTPLHYIVECRDAITVLGLLLSLVPRERVTQSINKKNFDGQTCLHIAVGQKMASDKLHTLIRLLLEFGADVTAKNSSKQTPFNLLPQSHDSQIAQLLNMYKSGKR